MMKTTARKKPTTRTARASHRGVCPLCEEYCVPNGVTRRAIAETEGSMTFADAKSAFAYLMETE